MYAAQRTNGGLRRRQAEPRLERSGTVREAQRVRMVLAAAAAAREVGIANVTVAEIVARSGVSRRTFYEVFDNAGDCLLTAFHEGVARATAVVEPAYMAGGTWRERVGLGLEALLGFLDEQKTLGDYCLVEALGAGEAVLAARAVVVERLVDAIDQGRLEAPSQAGLSRLSAEASVGAVQGILHARLVEDNPESLTSLTGPLMSVLLRPYLGPEVAAAELERPAPEPPSPPGEGAEALRGLGVRWTYRTIMVLESVGAQPGASNRQVASAAGVVDQGQISRVLTRLMKLGLIENLGGPAAKGEANAWKLTKKGTAVEAVLKDRASS